MAQKALQVAAPNTIDRNAHKVVGVKAKQCATGKGSTDLPQEPAHTEELHHESREQQEQNAAKTSPYSADQTVEQNQVGGDRYRQNPSKL